MKLKLLLVGFIPFLVFSQTEEIAEWQNKHPEVIFIEQSVYNSFSEEQLSQLNENVIVFNNEIQESDLSSYLEQKSAKVQPNVPFSYLDSNADIIKQWIGQRNIPIVSRESFNALSADEQTKLNELDALIFEGKYLTLNEIEDYEATH